MAEFRKLFYAFGLAALLTGMSSTASAQNTTCTTNAGVPPVIRSESFADLVGDLVLDCTGGIPTAQGLATDATRNVPQVNFTITLSTQITSRLLSGSLSEALLLIDEPNTPTGGNLNPVTGNTNATPLLPCGTPTLAPDNTSSGPGVCTITLTGSPSLTAAQTYNGTSGRPNVFQGRASANLQPGAESNVLVFAGVPFDPPGTTNGINGPVPAHRYLRFTNIRANAPLLGTGFVLQTITMYVNVNVSNIAINNPSQVVAAVQRGLVGPTVTAGNTFVQCTAATLGDGGAVTFTEGFESSFKVRNWAETTTNGTVSSGAYRTNGNALFPANVAQNIPSSPYGTESGFYDGSFTTTNGLNLAGLATQGTRLVVSFRDIPAGLTVYLPTTADLTRSGTTTVTGKARLVNTQANGSDPTTGFAATADATGVTGYAALGSSNLAVYEVVFSDSSAVEDIKVPVKVTFSPNLASNLPEPFKTASAAGGFAPFLSSSDANWQLASSSNPVPRFRNGIANYGNLFSLNKCACNLLFPFVTNAAVGNTAYDTGIAIANTSSLPGTSFGFNTGGNTSQRGAVQFWYYPALSTTTAPPTQCTNTTSPGTCPGTKEVLAGETLTYVLSTGSSQWGLVGAPGFTGYMVAQTQFQYCHAFAYIAPQGAGPLTNGMSVGYLGLILDRDRGASRTNNTSGEALNQ